MKTSPSDRATYLELIDEHRRHDLERLIAALKWIFFLGHACSR
jgi:hypothetical protein